MIKKFAVAAAFAAGALVTAVPAAQASPLSECVVRSANGGYTVSSSVEYCAQFYAPTSTVTKTATSTVTSTVHDTEYIPVEAEADPGDWLYLAAFVIAAAALGAGGTALWTRTRRARGLTPPAHATWTPPPVADAHPQQHEHAAAQADAHAQQQYAPPPTYAPAEPEPTYDAHTEPTFADAHTRTERARTEPSDPFGGLF